MPALAADYFSKTYQGLTTTLSATKALGAASMSLNSATNFPTTTGIKAAVYDLDANGDINTSTLCVYRGKINGSTIDTLTLVEGTDRAHSAGASVSLLFTATHWNDVMDGILADHSQTGGHEIATNYDPSNPTLGTQKWVGVSSAVNEISVLNATTGNFPTIQATGEADTGIDFENSEGEEILKLDAVASAVNELTITNAATVNSPSISASGGDTNIGIAITPKGTAFAYIDNFYGWQRGAGTWTYVSATTFTVTAADALLISKGTKLKFVQTTNKYFYVASISGTTVTIIATSDYTLANAAITAPFFSNAATPVGFPTWFNYAPTYTGFSAVPTGSFAQYRCVGSEITVAHRQTTLGTSNSTSYTITAPVTAATVSGAVWSVTLGSTIDNSSQVTTAGQASIGSAGTTFTMYKTQGTAASWTASGGKTGDFITIYQF